MSAVGTRASERSLESRPAAASIRHIWASRFSWSEQTRSVGATIANLSDFRLPAGRLKFLNATYITDSFAVEAIPPWGEVKVVATLRARQGDLKRVDDIHESTTLAYYDDKWKQLATMTVNDRLSIYTDKFAKKPDIFLGVKRFNIMIFGLYGAGKSSFINTVMTLMSPYDVVITNAAIVGGGEEHTTTKLRGTKIPDENGGMVLWDTWGVSDETYQRDELRLILEGILANNWDMSSCDRLIDMQDKLQRGIASAAQRKQHAVIFMFPYTLFCDESVIDARVRDAKLYFKQFLRQGIQPLVVITQADAQCPELRKNPTNTYPQTEQMRSTCAKQLGVNLGHVYLQVNYIAERERNFNIDKNTFRILEAAQNRAIEQLTFEAKRVAHTAAEDPDELDYGSDEELVPPLRGAYGGLQSPHTEERRPQSARTHDTRHLEKLVRSIDFSPSRGSSIKSRFSPPTSPQRSSSSLSNSRSTASLHSASGYKFN